MSDLPTASDPRAYAQAPGGNENPLTLPDGAADLGGGVGTLSVVVWPNHAGAVNDKGEEPMFGFEYRRGQISWELDEKGKLLGHARIEVPAGQWCWIIYCRNPFHPGFVSAQKLAHPLILTEPGVIELHGITEDDIKPINPDPALHD